MMRSGSDKGMQRKREAFVRKAGIKAEGFEAVLQTIRHFIAEPFTAAIEKRSYSQKWSAIDLAWFFCMGG